jgi:SPP1 gp7 family putative phage head morphogenesis protein
MGFKEWATRSSAERTRERADLKVRWAANKAKFAEDRSALAGEREGKKPDRVAKQNAAAVAKAEREQTPGTQTSPAEGSSFWDEWVPGDIAAAELLSDGGLAKLLARSNESIDGIEGMTLDRLGNLLADGVRSGDSVDKIARSLRGLVNDPHRAYAIANTETARAMSKASMDQYAASGVKEVDWLDSQDACQQCAAYAANGPYPLDDAPVLPPHVSCRCSYGPRDPGM